MQHTYARAYPHKCLQMAGYVDTTKEHMLGRLDKLADNKAEIYIPILFASIASEVIAMAEGNTGYTFAIML